MDDQLLALSAQLATLAITNSAAAIAGRVSAAKKGKSQEAQINELTELVNQLVDERNQAISIALGFKSELEGRTISEAELKFITETLMPAITTLMPLGSAGSPEMATTVAAIKSVLTPEMLTVLQLIGFDYRQAIGEPLTVLLKQRILASMPKASSGASSTTGGGRKR